MLLLLAACPAESPPAGSCTPVPSGTWSGGTVFEEKTSDWGLDGITGGLFAAGDLNGDGWPDLVVTEVFDNVADDPDAGVYYHRILLNTEVDGRRTFVDHTLESGFLTNRSGGVGHAGNVQTLGDVDGDGDLDLFSGRYRAESTVDAVGSSHEIYLNDGAAHFTLYADAGLAEEDPFPMMAGIFVDADADGALDLFWAGWYKDYGYSYDGTQPRLWKGRGDGSFTEVTDDALPKFKSANTTSGYIERDRRRAAMGATACDVDGDSWPDLLVSNYGRGWNFLLHNDEGVFTEVGEAAGVDADGNLDYTDNLWYACYCESNSCDPEPTERCGGSFPDNYWVPGFDDQQARLGGNTFTTVCGDVDNDGDMDLLHTEIAHSWAGGSSDASQLLENDGTGSFTRVDNEDNGLARKRPNLADWNEGDIWGSFLDFDNDGWQDVFIVSTDYPDTTMHLFRQVEAGRFEEVSEETGMAQAWPYGINGVDFDRDGDLDILTGSSTARSGTPWTDHQVHFYENGSGGNWLEVAGLPIGTRVEVSAGGVTQTQEVSGGFGRGSVQHDVVVHFGLGDVCAVDSVRVTRPGGAAEEQTEVLGNQRISF